MKPPSQAAIGRALRISPSAVTKFKAMGMPVDSVQNAHAWRQNNIKPSVHTAARRRPGESPASMADTSVENAQSLMTIAEASLEAGEGIGAMVQTLRAALAAVPQSRRDSVMVSGPVMDVLVADVASCLATDADGPSGSVEAMTDAEALDMGRFWYRVAAGEIQPSPSRRTS